MCSWGSHSRYNVFFTTRRFLKICLRGTQATWSNEFTWPPRRIVWATTELLDRVFFNLIKRWIVPMTNCRKNAGTFYAPSPFVLSWQLPGEFILEPLSAFRDQLIYNKHPVYKCTYFAAVLIYAIPRVQLYWSCWLQQPFNTWRSEWCNFNPVLFRCCLNSTWHYTWPGISMFVARDTLFYLWLLTTLFYNPLKYLYIFIYGVVHKTCCTLVHSSEKIM